MVPESDDREPATKGDIRRFAEATKADVQHLAEATKADVQRLEKATKADIGGLAEATKAEFRRFEEATKGDFRRLAEALVKTQAKVDAIESRMATRDDVSRILGAIDAFAGKAESYDRKALSHGDIIQDNTARLRDHERRISALEERRDDPR